MNTVRKHINTKAGQVFVSYRPSRSATGGPTAVFIHGWGGDHRVWSPVVEGVQAGSLSIDLPGFGASDTPSRVLTVDDYADIVSTIVLKCELSEVVLVGHSFGGQIVSALAARQPAWLKGVVLVGSASLRSTAPPALSWLGKKLSFIFRLPVLKKLRPYIYKMIGADQPPENQVMQKIMRKALRADQRDRLSSISVPTQVIWGNKDTATPLAEGEEITRRIPDAVLAVLDGGHYIFLDQPTAFTDTLSTFINRLS